MTIFSMFWKTADICLVCRIFQYQSLFHKMFNVQSQLLLSSLTSYFFCLKWDFWCDKQVWRKTFDGLDDFVHKTLAAIHGIHLYSCFKWMYIVKWHAPHFHYTVLFARLYGDSFGIKPDILNILRKIIWNFLNNFAFYYSLLVGTILQ